MKSALGLCAVLLLSCQSADTAERAFRVRNLPPQPKDVIEAALAISRLPLSDPSCQRAGTELSDNTVGQYLAGFLAELSSQDARNALTTSVERQVENGEPVHVCRLMVRHAQNEDVWSWGVQFSVRQSDGEVLPASIRCIGGG